MTRISNVANLIILNSNNQVLLAKRNEDEEEKGKWSIPGGSLEIGENFEEALIREIKEELNSTISKSTYFKSYHYKVSEDFVVRAIYFYGEIKGEVQLNEELSEFKYYDIDKQLLELDLAFNQKDVLKDFVEYHQNNTN